MLDMHVASKMLRAASNKPIQFERRAQTYEIFTCNTYWKWALWRPDNLQFQFHRLKRNQRESVPWWNMFFISRYRQPISRVLACHAKNAEQHLLHFLNRVEYDIQAHIIGLVYLQDTQLLIEILGNVSVCKGRTPTRLRCTVRYRRYDTPWMNFGIKRIWENDQSNLLPASMADYIQQNITSSEKNKKKVVADRANMPIM